MFTIFDSGIGATSVSQAKRGKLSPPERLLRDLQAHRDSQAVITTRTKRAKDLATSPLAEYLLQMVGENQARQAELLARLAASLQDALSWSHSADALPDPASGSERAETIRSVHELLRLEQSRARSARRLAKAYKGIGSDLERALLEGSAMAGESNAQLLSLWLRSFKAATSSTTTLAKPGFRPDALSKQATKGRSTTASNEDEPPTLAA